MEKLSANKLKELAIDTAQRNDVDFDESAKISFSGPRRGEGFSNGPFTMNIPKIPEFAPFILEIDNAVSNFDYYNRSNQISRDNEGIVYRLTFDAWQFSSAFGGLYRSSEFCKTLEQFVDSDDNDDFEGDDDSIAVLRVLGRTDKDFLQVGYLGEEYSYRGIYTRVLISSDKDIEGLPKEIPGKYKHKADKNGIRFRMLKELRFDPFSSEVSFRFPSNSSRIIYLKGHKGNDTFLEDACHLAVDGKPLTLTPYRDDRFAVLTKKFNEQSLWSLYGARVAAVYAAMKFPRKMVEDQFNYNVYRAWELLKRK